MSRIRRCPSNPTNFIVSRRNGSARVPHKSLLNEALTLPELHLLKPTHISFTDIPVCAFKTKLTQKEDNRLKMEMGLCRRLLWFVFYGFTNRKCSRADKDTQYFECHDLGWSPLSICGLNQERPMSILSFKKNKLF